MRSESADAGMALSHALSRHAVTAVPQLATSIAEAAQAPGWCALDSTGMVSAQLVRASSRSRLFASLDDKPIPSQFKPDRRCLTIQLPPGWRSGRKLRVTSVGVDLLGSPIELDRITRVEGFVDSLKGDLHGWVWYPNDPDRDPVLSISPHHGRGAIEVEATAHAPGIGVELALARPRGFRIPADQLRDFRGLIHVRTPDSRDLIGSPLDPSAERRDAEIASRHVADLFPAPGRGVATESRHPVFFSLPAHVTGGPVSGGYKKRPVEIVVPVYGALDATLACLDSVLADLPSWASVVVVDDASPDPRIAVQLGVLAAAGRITVLTQARNRGFPASANAGMRHDARRDVVLLNSDTLVPPGWLTSLREAAYSSADIGSATPLSNDASILSYPSSRNPNAIPDLDETIRLDALARSANGGSVVDIPTAVGFCVFIKRDCLNDTGLLREDLFAQGYGEENDFCIRGRHLGWRHVAVPGLFVAHVGAQSFGLAKKYLLERNIRKLNEIHPGYDVLIQEFLRDDPLAEWRRNIDVAQWRTSRTGSQSVLLISHGRSGGVQQHVAERAAALRAEGLRPIMLIPAPSQSGEDRAVVLSDGPEGGTPNLRFSVPTDLDALAQLLKADNPIRAEVHHLVGHDHRVLDLLRMLNVPYDIVVHDYSWFCPRINLIDVHRRYCGEPAVTACEACVADAGPMNDENTSPRALRTRSAAEMIEATSVVVPSSDVAFRIRRHFPEAHLKVRSWEEAGELPPANPQPQGPDGMRRICVIGAIGIEKGYEVLLACARDAANRRLNLRFMLVGYSCDDARLTATGRVHITGKYASQDVIRLIRQQQAQVAWLPSIWPETWCYTLTHAWRAGLNVLAFDIGTPAERIRQTERGWLCPLGLAPQVLNERMLSLKPTQTEPVIPMFAKPATDAIKNTWPRLHNA